MNFYQHDVEAIVDRVDSQKLRSEAHDIRVNEHKDKWSLLTMYGNAAKKEAPHPSKLNDEKMIFQTPEAETSVPAKKEGSQTSRNEKMIFQTPEAETSVPAKKEGSQTSRNEKMIFQTPEAETSVPAKKEPSFKMLGDPVSFLRKNTEEEKPISSIFAAQREKENIPTPAVTTSLHQVFTRIAKTAEVKAVPAQESAPKGSLFGRLKRYKKAGRA